MSTQSQTLSATERTRLRRHSERGKTEQADLLAVLDAGMICHLGVVLNGAPLVLPTAYGRIGDTLYLHGSSANRSLHAADGREVCVTVTHLDGLVCARAVFSHSVNYRCAVVFGTARIVTGLAERLAGLRAVTEQLIPGRWDAVRSPTRKELAATSVLAVSLGEASVKVRTGAARRRARGPGPAGLGWRPAHGHEFRRAGARPRARSRGSLPRTTSARGRGQAGSIVSA